MKYIKLILEYMLCFGAGRLIWLSFSEELDIFFLIFALLTCAYVLIQQIEEELRKNGK